MATVLFLSTATAAHANAVTVGAVGVMNSEMPSSAYRVGTPYFKLTSSNYAYTCGSYNHLEVYRNLRRNTPILITPSSAGSGSQDVLRYRDSNAAWSVLYYIARDANRCRKGVFLRNGTRLLRVNSIHVLRDPALPCASNLVLTTNITEKNGTSVRTYNEYKILQQYDDLVNDITFTTRPTPGNTTKSLPNTTVAHRLAVITGTVEIKGYY